MKFSRPLTHYCPHHDPPITVTFCGRFWPGKAAHLFIGNRKSLIDLGQLQRGMTFTLGQFLPPKNRVRIPENGFSVLGELPFLLLQSFLIN